MKTSTIVTCFYVPWVQGPSSYIKSPSHLPALSPVLWREGPVSMKGCLAGWEGAGNLKSRLMVVPTLEVTGKPSRHSFWVVQGHDTCVPSWSFPRSCSPCLLCNTPKICRDCSSLLGKFNNHCVTWMILSSSSQNDLLLYPTRKSQIPTARSHQVKSTMVLTIHLVFYTNQFPWIKCFPPSQNRFIHFAFPVETIRISELSNSMPDISARMIKISLLACFELHIMI